MTARFKFTGYGLARCVPVVAVLLICVFLFATAPCEACFSVVVGKDASTNGCVIVGHNEDDTAPQIVNHHKIARTAWPAGTVVRLRNGGALEQAGQTWAYIWSEMPGMLFSDSYVNEWGVTVTSDNCPSREDRPEMTDGGIGYMLRRLVAERARTARDGVLLAGTLVERFGYIDSGRTYIIADPEEGWLFGAMNGKHWLARRVPDDRVAMVANTYTIRRVDLADQDNVLASRDIVAYAESRGWYDRASDGPFDFAAVYANPQAASNPNNSGRQRAGLMYATDAPLESGADLPFSVVPRHRLSVTDVMEILRHDKDSGPGSAPADSPFICALCSGATQTSFVAQLRRAAAAEIGLVYWVCLASPRTSFFVPFHFGISDFPDGFRLASRRPASDVYDRKVRAPLVIGPQEAFWMFSNFRNKIERSGPAAVARAKAEARRIERDAVTIQKSVEQVVGGLYQGDREAAIRILENYSKGVYLSCMEAMSAVSSER